VCCITMTTLYSWALSGSERRRSSISIKKRRLTIINRTTPRASQCSSLNHEGSDLISEKYIEPEEPRYDDGKAGGKHLTRSDSKILHNGTYSSGDGLKLRSPIARQLDYPRPRMQTRQLLKATAGEKVMRQSLYENLQTATCGDKAMPLSL